MMDAKVSIIVGVYNGERYLAELLDSVLAQTSSAWSCICVDDGSVDSSVAILEAYVRKDARFRIVSQPNGGVGAARNAGLAATDTKYVMFADQDDKLLPTAVATALDAIESSKADIVRFASNRKTKVSIFVWEHIFRHSVFRDVRFLPVTGGEDTAFFWALGFLGLKVSEIRDELYWNRANERSFSRAVTPGYIQNVFVGFRYMRETGQRNGLPPLKLFARMFPHVFWFSVSVVARHFSPGNLRALLFSLANLLFVRSWENGNV